MTASSHTELAFVGPFALAELVRGGEVHPRELVDLYLRRIEALDPTLNAFRTTLPEQALAEAEAASGRDGLLAGVPIAVKDDLPLAGQVATKGARLRAAGPGRRRGDPAAAGRRGDPDRDHQRARADDLSVDGHRRQRRHPQPVGPGAHPGRLLGRLGGGGRRRPGRRSHRV